MAWKHTENVVFCVFKKYNDGFARANEYQTSLMNIKNQGGAIDKKIGAGLAMIYQ